MSTSHAHDRATEKADQAAATDRAAATDKPAATAPSPSLDPLGDVVVPDALLVSYDNYAAAQRTVDHLSDQQFPVENTAIIGSDLRLVEKVTGRLTLARAALAGAVSGAWLGLLLGLVLGLFTDRPWGWLATVLVTVLIFVFWGAVFGLAAHALTGGKRDFASRSAIVAGRYDVRVAATHIDQARRLLGEAR